MCINTFHCIDTRCTHTIRSTYAAHMIRPILLELFKGLLQQCKQLGLVILEHEVPDAGEYNVIMDAVFGFSFSAEGGIRAPFDSVIQVR